MASGLQSLPVPGHKKRRLQGACDICKHKKVRCDSAEMPGGRCSNCIAFDSECTHATAKKRGISHHKLSMNARPTLAQDFLDELSSGDDSQRATHSLIQSILSSSSYDGPNDVPSIRQSLAKLAQHALRLEQELATLKESPKGKDVDFDTSILIGTPVSNVSTSASTNDGDDIGLSENLKRLTIESWHKRFFGPSSTFMLIKTAMEMQKASDGGQTTRSNVPIHLRPIFWTKHPWESVPSDPPPSQHFPDHDLLMHLVQLFFDNINIHFPLLHRPTFEKSICDNLHLTDHLFGASVLALCAVASRYSNDPCVILEGTSSLHSSGWQWHRQLKLCQRPLSQVPSVYELQAIILSVLFLQGTSTPDASWPLIGIGIRFAQDVGAHRRKFNHEPSVEDELWKRAFWILTSFDVILCSFLGRPRATNSKDYDLDLPIECDDEYWEITDTQISFQQPPGKHSRVASFIAYLKLMEILDAAQRTIYSVNKSSRLLEGPLNDHQVVIELDSELNKWVDSLPNHLRWDQQNQDPVSFEQSAILYATYYYIQILIHRPFIPSPKKPSPLPFPSLAICTNAARSCIHLMELVSQRGYVPLPNIQMALFASAVVLLLNVWAGKLSGFSGDPAKDLQGVVNCIDVMRFYESRWLSAGRMCDTICELAAAGGIQLPFVSNLKGESYQEPLLDSQDGVVGFYNEGKEKQAQPEFSDLGRSPDYHPFDGSIVGEDQWYQSSLHRGFTSYPEYGIVNPFASFGDAFASSSRDDNRIIQGIMI